MGSVLPVFLCETNHKIDCLYSEVGKGGRDAQYRGTENGAFP